MNRNIKYTLDMAKVTMRIYGALSRHRTANWHQTKPSQAKPNEMKSTVFHCQSIPYRGLPLSISLAHFNCFAFSTVIIIKFISKMINRNSTNTHSLTQIKLWYSICTYTHTPHRPRRHFMPVCTRFKFSFILHQPPKNDEEKNDENLI